MVVNTFGGGKSSRHFHGNSIFDCCISNLDLCRIWIYLFKTILKFIQKTYLLISLLLNLLIYIYIFFNSSKLELRKPSILFKKFLVTKTNLNINIKFIYLKLPLPSIWSVYIFITDFFFLSLINFFFLLNLSLLIY